jgi:LysR family transcriptional regulator, nitrogen assimilation regulatory protein
MRARTEDVLLAPRFEIDVLSTIVKLVESTRFATILPRIVRHIVRISHPRRPLSAAAETLIDTIADELRLVSSASTRDENASPRASQSNETAAQTRAS